MTKAYTIRKAELEDLPMMLLWRNDPRIRKCMLTRHEISLEEHTNWFIKANADKEREILIVENSNLPIGVVQFSILNKYHVADWSFHINPEASKGTGKKLGVTALKYAFTDLNLHKVCGQVLDFNERSIAFHDRLGFAREGLLREQYEIDGRRFSIVCFGFLKSEWIRDNQHVILDTKIG